jgi:2-methylcitrate dehydratase PrpD
VGTLLGWRHYQAGWHTTATAGVIGAAVAGATARGLTAEQTAAAIALSVSAASGVQRAFGSDAKPLQVGMATAAGLQAAELAAAGAQPDLDALDAWLPLVQASCRSVPDGEESIPGGLAVKIFPCCYALQRPIFAVREIARHQRLNPEDIVRIEITAPESTVKPLIHDRPANGAQGKFSLEYGIAAAVLDGFPGQWSFGDEAVRRPAAQQLRSRVRFRGTGTGKGLLDGRCEIAVHLRDGEVLTAEVDLPEGAPGRPPALEILTAKAASCLDGLEESIDDIDWESSASLLSAYAPSVTPARVGD